ncbi:MAG: carboxypeptidase regulatory-like domain-containing protein [Betaproteobacteria bacterium]
MRKVVSIGLVFMLAFGLESGVFAAGRSSGSVMGTARGSNMQPLASAQVQLRNIDTGETVATTTTDQAGAFVFADVQPGSYIVEVVDPSRKVLGIGAPFSVASGQSASTSVLTLAGSAARSGGGFRLFGMGAVTSMTVLGAAAAASVTAVVTTRPDASPSR